MNTASTYCSSSTLGSEQHVCLQASPLRWRFCTRWRLCPQLHMRMRQWRAPAPRRALPRHPGGLRDTALRHRDRPELQVQASGTFEGTRESALLVCRCAGKAFFVLGETTASLALLGPCSLTLPIQLGSSKSTLHFKYVWAARFLGFHCCKCLLLTRVWAAACRRR